MLITRPRIELIRLDWSLCGQYFHVAPSKVQIQAKTSSSITCLLVVTINDPKQGKGEFLCGAASPEQILLK